MNTQKVKFHNRFDLEIYDIKTGETEHAKAENIVLNQVVGKPFYYIQVGTGTGTLDPTRTRLFNYLSYNNATGGDIIYDSDTTAHRVYTTTFTETQAIGTWTEIGMAHGVSSTSDLITHALFTDSEGIPITIEKTNTKIITVYATIYVEVTGSSYKGENNQILSSIFKGIPSRYNTRFLFSSLKTIDGVASSFAVFDVSEFNQATYQIDTVGKRVYTPLVRSPVGEENGPIRGIILTQAIQQYYTQCYAHQGLVNEPLNLSQGYTNIPVGTGDGVTYQFDLPVAFPLENSESIYINGVKQTRGVDYTMKHGMLSSDSYLVDVTTIYGKYGGNYFVRVPANTPYEEIIELPQPTGSEAMVTAVSITANSMTGVTAYVSVDNVNWVNALQAFSPDTYRYLKISVNSASNINLATIKVAATPPADKHITFGTPPSVGAAITADFSIGYINKTENFVLDLQADVYTYI